MENHIQYLEQLRQVIGLRSYGQRDPLVEYKKEAFHSFETLLNKIRQDIIMILLNLKIIDEIIPEPTGGAHRDKNLILENVKMSIDKNLNEKLRSLSEKEISSSINSNFKKKREERNAYLGEEGSKEIEKKIFLQLIDLNWKNHIQYLEQLRQVIGLRSYGQRDPLVEYKKEAFHSFERLLNKIRQDIVMILLNLKIVEKGR